MAESFPTGLPDAETEPTAVRQYARLIEKEFAHLESVDVALDRSAKIKTEGQEEATFKAPDEVFVLGYPTAERKMEEDIRAIKKQCWGLGGFYVNDMRGLRCADFSSPESRAALKTDVDSSWAMAHADFHHTRLDAFAGVESREVDYEDQNVMVRDREFRNIQDEEISRHMRTFNYYTAIRNGRLSESEVEGLLALDAEDGTFVPGLLDYAIRKSLESSHDWSLAIFQALKANEGWYESLADGHKSYSLPYLFERDLYGRWQGERDPERALASEARCKELVGRFGIDIDDVRARLAGMGATRSYCARIDR